MVCDEQKEKGWAGPPSSGLSEVLTRCVGKEKWEAMLLYKYGGSELTLGDGE